MYTGSMVGAGFGPYAVMGYVISNQKPNPCAGYYTVDLNVKLLAPTFGESDAVVQAAVDYLCAPDPLTTTPGEDGRRLIKIGAFSYRVVNGSHYNKIKNEEDRREQLRQAQQRYRDKKTTGTNSVSDQPPSDAAVALQYLNVKSGRKFRETPVNLGFIEARLKESGVDLAGVKVMIDRQVLRWKGDAKMEEYIRPATLFNKVKFDGYYAAKDLAVTAPASNGKGLVPDYSKGF